MAEQFEISKAVQDFLKRTGSRSTTRIQQGKDVKTFVSSTIDAENVPADGQATP